MMYYFYNSDSGTRILFRGHGVYPDEFKARSRFRNGRVWEGDWQSFDHREDIWTVQWKRSKYITEEEAAMVWFEELPEIS